jgi:hypothetical protein
MSLKHDLTAYRVMESAEAREALHLALLLNLHRLPQLKGKGRVLNPDARSNGAKSVADAMAAQFDLSGVILLKGPLMAHHNVGEGPKSR